MVPHVSLPKHHGFVIGCISPHTGYKTREQKRTLGFQYRAQVSETMAFAILVGQRVTVPYSVHIIIGRMLLLLLRMF